MNFSFKAAVLPIVLLTISNVFMTFAWYGHLKFKSKPLWIVILASWGIAFLEYCFMVPANRWGHAQYSAIQLKIIQEVITLTVFSGFVIYFLGEKMRWNHIAAVAFTFLPKDVHSNRPLDETTQSVNAEPK
ncbi:MAG: DMT family protein [Limisphaerales bacterium]